MGPRRLIALASAFLAAGVTPAYASSTWHAVGGIPAAAQLTAVATDGTVVVAVGTAGGSPVAYRLVGGTWQADPLQAGPPTRVALAGHTAYALSGNELLTLADDTVAGPARWAQVGDRADLTAFALSPDGTGGFAGASDGTFLKFAAGSFVALSETGTKASSNPVAAVGAGSATAGVAIRDGQFYTLDATAGSAALATSVPSATCSPSALAGTTLAAGGSCWWDQSTNGAWTSHGLVGTANDVAQAGGAAAIAGASGGQGVVWRRSGTGAWTEDYVASAPLRGVALTGADDLWAVGDAGTVEHYFPDPPPPPTTTTKTDGGTGGDGQSGNGGSDQSDGDTSTSTQRQPSDFQIIIDDPNRAPKRGGGTPVYVDDGSSAGSSPTTHRGTKPARPQRLMRHVSVRVVKGGLRIDFDLAAPATVAVVATRGNHAIGQAQPRAFAAGHGRIVIHYRGRKPPTSLRIVARRSHKATR